ncbi:MAG: single-stranded-DNA-specific exonuclease RecJ, partial [Clostridia bacterium]|nr:single-stranded-DNA-specific exonuclease RecJ [Clostridia bacterium]
MEELKRERVWSVMYTPANEGAEQRITQIASSVGVSHITARLLYNRGYDTPEKAAAFLNADMTSLHDPYLMKDMDKAVARISRAISAGEKIAIYGDYDVDGVTSVTSLYLYLQSKGADVTYYIPSRDKEGYGLCNSAIDMLAQKGITLIITVDTGITADSEVLYASSIGIEMVI